MSPISCGKEMYQLLRELYPICRSITGNGVRKTLQILQQHIPLTMHEVPSGTPVFDWTVPEEWNIQDAYILDPEGNKIVDFQQNNLHVVGYCVPVNLTLPLAELQEHLHSLPEQIDAIPCVTSYYKRWWGFCLTHNQRMSLPDGQYHVYIDSELKAGHLTYGELHIPGVTTKEVFLSTYICHPSMANNELSGPVVTTFLTKWLLELPRYYTYRIVFVPETIGALTYLSQNLRQMKERIVAGLQLTCLGDDRAYSYLPSRQGDTLADKVALYVLHRHYPGFHQYSFLDRGSDERQYCSPGVDLPIASLMRSKYGTYPEYHTSLDNLDFVTSEGLQGGYDLVRTCLEVVECNRRYRTTCLGEPQMGKRGLYPTLSHKGSAKHTRLMMNVLAYADGKHDVIDLSTILRVSVEELQPIVGKLVEAGLLVEETDHKRG